MVNCQLRNEQHTNLLPEVEECCAQEATIEALPNRIWEARKVRVDVLGVNDQGTELSHMLFRNWLPLGSLPSDYPKGTAKFPYRQIDPHLQNGMDLKTPASQLSKEACTAIHPLGPHCLGMDHVWSYTLKPHVLHSPGQNIKNRDCSPTIQHRLHELSTKRVCNDHQHGRQR